MKRKNRIWIVTLFVTGFILIHAISCDNAIHADYAGEIEGTYVGTVTVVGTGTVPATSILTKSSEKEVDLEIKIGTSSVSLDNIDVSSPEDDIYDLKYTDISGSFTGKVEEKRLTWTLTAGNVTETFSGTK